jgi:hypothetical protein
MKNVKRPFLLSLLIPSLKHLIFHLILIYVIMNTINI